MSWISAKACLKIGSSNSMLEICTNFLDFLLDLEMDDIGGEKTGASADFLIKI